MGLLTSFFETFDFKYSESLPVLISFIAGLILLVIFIHIDSSDKKLLDRKLLDQKYHELIQEENKKSIDTENTQKEPCLKKPSITYKAVYRINGKTIEVVHEKTYN